MASRKMGSAILDGGMANPRQQRQQRQAEKKKK
jgi:hypothetical protein